MQFTPQQLSGGSRYSNCTRIGNWQEEITVEESKLDNFQQKSKAGSLLLRKQQTKLKKCNEVVPHTYSADGVIRFGDYVIISHDKTNTVLACDPFEEVIFGTSRFLTTTFASGSLTEAKARYTFRICRPPSSQVAAEDNELDPVLRIGQAFCLACNESLLVQDGADILNQTLFLNSTKKNDRDATKTTNRQLVYMSPDNGPESVWFVTKPSKGKTNAIDRYLSVGQPATVDDALQITHRQTNNYLTCDPAQALRSEFGIDFELYADRAVSCGKLGLLSSEFKGMSTVETLSKADAPQFSWHFVTSLSEQSGKDERCLPQTATIEVLVHKMREFIISQGMDAFWNLRLFFQQLEKKVVGDGTIDREDLRDALLKWGCPFDHRFLEKIIDLKDQRQVGMVDWRDFVSMLRGELPLARRNIILDVFTSLSLPHETRVPLDVLSKAFNGSEHPLVALGGAAPQQAFEHFVRCTSLAGSSKKVATAVTVEAFVDYFADLSPAVDDDGYFEMIVRGCFPNQ